MGACLSRDELGDRIPRNAAIDCSRLTESDKPIICLIGGPGAGKTTVSKRLATKYGLTPILLSDLMRAEASSGTPRGDAIKKVMREGRNLPADIIVQEIEEKMMENLSSHGWLLVGFPRDKSQIKIFIKEVRRPNLCIHLWARRQVLEERMRSRAISRERFDDTDMILAERIKTFFNTIHGVLGILKKVTTDVDAEKSEEDVLQLASSAVDSLLESHEH